MSRFMFLLVDIELSQRHLSKDYSFSSELLFFLLSKISSLYVCGSTSGISIVLFIYSFSNTILSLL